MKCITPPSSACPASAPVDRSNSNNVMSASAASGLGPVVTVSTGFSLENAMNNGTSPGRIASALSSIASSGSRPGPSPDDAIPAANCGSPASASISSWKISGRPVTHSISRNAVQTMLVHLWTRYQARIDDRVIRDSMGLG